VEGPRGEALVLYLTSKEVFMAKMAVNALIKSSMKALLRLY
jgi:hypothetical protein